MVEDRDIEAASESHGTPSPDLIRAISDALGGNEPARAAELVRDLKAPDLADIVELLEPEERIQLIQAIGPAFDYEVLSELDEGVRDQVSEALPNEILAKAVTQLDTDDAAYVIESLEESDQKEILAHLPTGERQAIERNLEYPEDTAGRLMQSDFVAVPPFWTVGHVVDHMRESDDLPDISPRSSSSTRRFACSAPWISRAYSEASETSPLRRSWTPTATSCWRRKARRNWPASSSATI